MTTKQDVVATALALLGTVMRDKVTGFQGMVGTVGFDVYGCVQVILVPITLRDDKRQDGEWFDLKRLAPSVDVLFPILPSPFIAPVAAGSEPGPEPKPAPTGMLR